MIVIVAHELTPSEGPAWDLAVSAAPRPVVLLHTRPVGLLVSGAVRTRAAALGLTYRHIDEEPPGLPAPVFPAIEAHRLGLRLAHSPTILEAEEIWFAGDPAHAASIAAARRTDAFAAAGRKAKGLPVLRLHIATLAEDKRVRAGRFPTGGKAEMAVEFLERRAVEMADEVIFSDPVEAAPPLLSLNPSRRSAPPVSGRPLAAKGGRVSSEGAASTPRVSVCVTYYEKADFLKEALDSLAVQAPRPFEVIVIDDGSKSAAAADAWKKANDRYWALGWKFLRQDNAGPSVARNRAAKEATGDALLFCDADNRFRPGMVAALARAMAASGAEAVSCAFQTFREGGVANEPSHIFAPLGPCLELALVENVLGDTTTLLRRETFLALGGFKPGLINEDWRLLLDWLRAGHTLQTLPAVLFDYRLGPTGRSGHESEYASAAAVLTPLLPTEPGWDRFWPHAAGALRDDRAARLEAEAEPLHREAQRLREENVAAEALRRQAEIAAAEARAEAAEAREAAAKAKIIDRMRRAHVFLVEAEERRRQEEASAAKSTAATLRRELTALTETAARDRTAAEKETAALRGRLRRMEQSFSWKATGLFRALRRALIDPGRRRRAAQAAPPAPTPSTLPIAWHIDAPRLWSGLEETVTVRGWCFAQSDIRFRSVRARVGARVYAGSYGGERPDLPLVFPAWPASGFSGFRIDVQLQAGDTAVALDAEDGAGVWHPFFHRHLGGDDAAAPGSYLHWLAAHPEPSGPHLAALRAAAENLPPRLISVLMPVFNPDDRWLRRALDSVREQTYPHWELCIADDASTAPHVARTLEEYARQEPRIKVLRRTVNGHISAATNSALGLAAGEFAALFDHDDELAPHALHCVAREIAANPGAGLIYTDEDKIDEQGVRFDPHFKPDWNPELLASQNYLSHLAVYRTTLLRELGGLRTGFEGCQDWDLALRATERLAPAQIRHVSRVLYHWRAGEGSTALHLGEKTYVADAARRALAEHFARVGETVELERTVGGHWHALHLLPADRPHPLVSIIIPTRNAGPLVRLCLASIFARTRYAPFEVLLVDNRSDDPESLEIFAAAEREDGVRVLRYDAPFNYSAINNFAAREARGDVLCLLNNDIEALEPRWLDELVGQAVRPGIGAVGARLYYPDFRVQHAGVITGLGGVAGHAFKYFERADPGTPQFRPHLTQNVSAVTAACLVIRKETYLAVGGFEESSLPVAFNDVDFCLRVEARGLRNVYCPFAELVHHESASRGAEDTPEKVRRFQSEIAAIQARWGARLLEDPAYNANLSLDSENFALAYPPRMPPL